jgi:hypothetical protein
MEYQQRVKQERQELDKKIESLTAFIGTPTYHEMDPHDQFLLRLQLVSMSEYSWILGERIARFK